MPEIIHSNQTAYMKNRFIGTNIRSVQDVIANQDCIVLFLDFCKAFNSVNHLFLSYLLLHIGFPPLFVCWIFTLYCNAQSMVRHKRWLTEKFQLLHGVHQGCPLSCHLFNLISQVLIYSLKNHGFFEWWTFVGDLCSLYADDTAIFFQIFTH